MPIPLTATVLTKNSARTLPQVLSSLASFDEILICDTGSSDHTEEIARAFPRVTFYRRPFMGFGPTHNVASALARHDWILSIDSDEVVSHALLEEIASTPLKRGHVYSFPRHNEYRGKWIQWCGWSPDRQVRLYHRQDTQFSQAQVHEAIEIGSLSEVRLTSPLIHYPYRDVSDFLRKMESYSTLFAIQYAGKKKSSCFKACLHAAYAFCKSYLLKRGFLGGREGFEISLYNANTAFYKYLKLADANEALKVAAKYADDLPRMPAAPDGREAATQALLQATLSDSSIEQDREKPDTE